MKLVSRISIRFDPREDRLRLTLTERDGRTLVLWLTWRLANAVVDGLLRAIEAFAGPGAAEAAPAAKRRTAANQFWAQTRAEMRMAGTASAPAPREAAAIELVRRVALRRVPREDRLFLEFHWSDDGAVIPVDENYLRQILTVFHRNYMAAGWSPKTMWPAWLGDGAYRSMLSANEIN
jgi:hypothetical protein